MRIRKILGWKVFLLLFTANVLFAEEIMLETFSAIPDNVSIFSVYDCWPSEQAALENGYAVYGNISMPTISFETVETQPAMKLEWNMSDGLGFQFRSIRYAFGEVQDWSNYSGVKIDVYFTANVSFFHFRFTMADLGIVAGSPSRVDELWWYDERITANSGEWVTLTIPFNQFYHPYLNCVPTNDDTLELGNIIAWEINSTIFGLPGDDIIDEFPNIYVKNLRLY